MQRAAKRTNATFNWDQFDTEEVPTAPAPQPVVATPPPPVPAPPAPAPKPWTDRQIAVEYRLWLSKNPRITNDFERQKAFKVHLEKKQAAVATAVPASPAVRDERTHLSSHSTGKQAPAKQWTNIAAFHEQKAISSDQLLADPAASDISLNPAELLSLAQTKVVSFLDFLTSEDKTNSSSSNAVNTISQRHPPTES